MGDEEMTFPNRNLVAWATLLLVMLLGLWVYRDVGSYGFVQFDDPALVINNPYVNRGLTADSVQWAFFFTENDGQRAEPFARELWAPLSFLSLASDVQFAGLNPAVHHRINLCMHLISTCLAFVFFLRLTQLPLVAGMVAAVFCFHPMHVESVAWISERKDVLSAMLVFGTLNLYLAWKQRKHGGGRTLWWGAILCFALACLAKPMAVVTPLLLVWIDAWLGVQSQDPNSQRPVEKPLLAHIRHKLPFVIIMFATAASTIAMKLAHAQPPTGGGSHLWGRLLEMPLALLYYLERTVWPKSLYAQYQRYPHEFLVGTLTGVVLISVIGWGAWFLRKRAPEWWFGWGWFIICLLPVIGFAYAGPSFTADRYTYLAHCGLAFAILFAMNRLVKRRATWLFPILLLNLLYLARIVPLAHASAGVWKNSEVLFRQGVAVEGNSAKNWNNLGALLVGKGDQQEGIEYLKHSIEIGGMPDAYYNLASIYIHIGAPPKQADYLLRECIKLDPKNGWAMEMLGNLLADPQLVGLYDPEESRELIARGLELQGN